VMRLTGKQNPSPVYKSFIDRSRDRGDIGR